MIRKESESENFIDNCSEKACSFAGFHQQVFISISSKTVPVLLDLGWMLDPSQKFSRLQLYLVLLTLNTACYITSDRGPINSELSHFWKGEERGAVLMYCNLLSLSRSLAHRHVNHSAQLHTAQNRHDS